MKVLRCNTPNLSQLMGSSQKQKRISRNTQSSLASPNLASNQSSKDSQYQDNL
jgi:hypothetical protein